MDQQKRIKQLCGQFIAKEDQYICNLKLLESIYIIEMPKLKLEDDLLRNVINCFQDLLTFQRQYSVHQVYLRAEENNYVKQAGQASNFSESLILEDLFECSGLLDVYKQYIELYNTLKRKLAGIIKKSSDYPKYLQCVSKAGKDLESLLALPVSHLNYYNDLFTQFLKREEDHSLPLLQSMKEFTATVSKLISLSFNITKEEKDEVIKLWNSFNQNELITDNPNRIILHKTNVVKYSRKGNKELLLVVFNDGLLIGKKKEGFYENKRFFHLYWIEICDFNESYISNGLSLSTPTKSYIFLFNNESNREIFKNKLSSAIKYDLLEHQDKFPQLLDCNNAYCGKKKNNPKSEMTQCQLCSKWFCKECIVVYDLCERKPIESVDSAKYKSLFCHLCSLQQTEDKDIARYVDLDTTELPPYWTEIKSKNDFIYQNDISHLTIPFHPDYLFKLEEINKESLKSNYIRLYTKDGDKFYQNLESGEVTWDIPKSQ